MRKAFDIFNAICVEDLSFDASLSPQGTYDLKEKERVLNEILFPEFSVEMPAALIPRVIWKIRRWRANAWKHRLCYNDTLWSAFWSGVKSHLLKPSSI